MARGVHGGAVFVVAAPGVAVDRELPLERLCGWSGRGAPLTRAQSGCLGGPRELRAGGEPLVEEARNRDGGCLRRTVPPQSRLAEMCGYLGAGHLQPPQRDMRLSWVLTILSICLSALATATGAEGKRKLQIGVKKRVDHCPIKSRKGDVLHMHYTGKLEDGTEFDSSLPQNQPFVFSLGTGQVIKGWDQGLLGMCEGEKRKLVIPSELGYGERGAPPKIPGGATLVFEVELLKIERRSEL
ncbi:peptidyl-prolyl cis-trans isomerase FKBP2 isoform X4 [Acomys russatus]|uniref:peptidyl-prolyl cis-trans isomerase FKBP2 isoform X4 n=1 Tax=Acomys russatus TaxID=60746 RepID=UPI0021E2C5ED|nr:peptidyl-prolyl cis-trans isomerase FKBP2 isoform X4 [Acomys russatus]